MNTYLAVETETGAWAVEWSTHGTVTGLTFGRYDNQVEAVFAAFALTRMEWAEARQPPGTNTPQPPSV
jgi:hypothetical protein